MCASKVITDLTWVSKDGCRQQVCVGFVPAHIVIKRLELFKKKSNPFLDFKDVSKYYRVGHKFSDT